jgi:GT2 family glycosyltransferase
MAGAIDQPGPGTVISRSAAVEVSGWIASQAGIESLEVFCDAKLVGQADHGTLRADVGSAYPYFKDAAHAGFFCIVDSERLAAGPHQLRVVARSRSGREGELTRQFQLGGLTSYAQWLKNNAPTTADKDALAARAAGGVDSPLITLLLVSEQLPDQAGIAATLRSISDQAYRKFEVLAVALGRAPWNVDVLAHAEDIADHIRVVAAGDGGLWKEAVPQARGDFIAVLAAGDVLDPRALLAVAENVAEVPTIDFLYADEDRIFDDGRGTPRFKPSYSPILLESRDYVGRPWFARRALVSSAVDAGGTNEPEFEHLLINRVGRAARAVAHVPMVLLSRADPRQNVGGCAAPGLSPEFAADEPWPRISIVIPTCLKAPDVVAKCLSALAERTDYPDLEIIVVVNNVGDARAAREFLGRWPVKPLTWDRPYTWSGINNFAARHAGGDHLLFLNDDVEPLSPGWLKRMVGLSRRPAVGAVGALLRYPNGMIQHGGITISNRTGCGCHLFRHRTGREPALVEIAGYTRECRAVTGACLLTRRECFEALGGFDEDMPLVANDIDYCLRLGERGYSTVIAAQSELTHHEGLSRGATAETRDIERFWSRWRARLSADDPFTNPNLDVHRYDWSVDSQARAALTARIWRGREYMCSGLVGFEKQERAMPSPVPSVLPADWPISPPFDFNSPTISQIPPEVTGRTLLADMCARLGWSSLAGKRLLDYGCGVRLVRTIVNLEMEIGQYAGVDLNGEAIAWLKANVRDQRFRFEQLAMRNPMYNPAGAPVARAALTELGLSGYDAACMFSVITHQEPADAATIFAMLRPCAPRLYFTAFIDDAIDSHEDRDPSCRCHYSFYSTAFLTRLLAQSGWRVEVIFPPGRFQQTAFVCA